jgi:hypothetical protein
MPGAYSQDLRDRVSRQSRGRPATVPAQILARSESYRAGLRQGENLDPKGSAENSRCHQQRNRQSPQRHPAARMRELSQRRRICVNLNAEGLSYDFSRRGGEKEPLGEGGCPLDSGEGRIGSSLTV